MLLVLYFVFCGIFLDYVFFILRFIKILWSCIGVVVVFFMVFLKSFLNVVWLSLIGILFVLVLVGFVMWYGIRYSFGW